MGDMSKEHHYELTVEWIGNLGQGTTGYRSYSRNHEVRLSSRPVIDGSSDVAFHGDPERWSPEQLFLAAASQCHLLWYLHLASDAGVVVTEYVDTPTAMMLEETSGAGQFAQITLHPVVTITDQANVPQAKRIHDRAGSKCFIARSVNLPISVEPTILVRPPVLS
jgi:organic hydroperoxide reductase OsmC/OhrA